MADNLLRLFPIQFRQMWSIAVQETGLQEIRLRAGKPAIIVTGNGEKMLDFQGNCTRMREKAYCPTQQELAEIMQHICHYSIYAFEDELKQGFITVSGGHRIGVAGQVVMEGDRIHTIKNISCMNIRIAHQIKGAADEVLSHIYRNGAVMNTLIISPPGCGKTTMLRDLIRQVSDGNRYGEGRCVGVVDERSEIAGCFQGIAQNDVGMRTDVLDGCPKALGMMMLIRSMSPKVIAVDEIGSRRDMEAIHTVSCSGCKVLATMHGEGIGDIRLKEGMDRLLEEGLFERFVILGRKNGRFSIDRICRGEDR